MDDAQVFETIGGAAKCGGVRPAINWGDARLGSAFWSKCITEPNVGCWLWLGEFGGEQKVTPVHGGKSARRFAYARLIGREFTSTQNLVPSCGVSECINPMHARIPPAREKRSSRPEYRREWEQKNGNPSKFWHLHKRYGIDRSDYERMLQQQNGGCAICGDAFDQSTHNTRACVDHCHNTGSLRGLLCSRCNRGVGFLRDRPDLLRAAALYLEKHGKT